MLVIDLLIINSLIEERDCKQGVVRAGGPCYIKIVFTQLTEVIAVYVQFFIV